MRYEHGAHEAADHINKSSESGSNPMPSRYGDVNGCPN
jgi:hypothetical protein